MKIAITFLNASNLLIILVEALGGGVGGSPKRRRKNLPKYIVFNKISNFGLMLLMYIPYIQSRHKKLRIDNILYFIFVIAELKYALKANID